MQIPSDLNFQSRDRENSGSGSSEGTASAFRRQFQPQPQQQLQQQQSFIRQQQQQFQPQTPVNHQVSQSSFVQRQPFFPQVKFIIIFFLINNVCFSSNSSNRSNLKAHFGHHLQESCNKFSRTHSSSKTLFHNKVAGFFF